jgi:hypothetical protein
MEKNLDQFCFADFPEMKIDVALRAQTDVLNKQQSY